MNRLIIAALVILVVVGAVLAATGVLHFQNTKDESIITIDKKELKEKTQEAVEKTSETLHKAAEGLQGPADNRNSPTTTPADNGHTTRQPDAGKSSPENGANQSDRKPAN